MFEGPISTLNTFIGWLPADIGGFVGVCFCGLLILAVLRIVL